jgi:hypothetical protein
VNVAVAEVEPLTFTLDTVIPLPASIVISETKLLPFRVTLMMVPGFPELEAIEVRNGGLCASVATRIG